MNENQVCAAEELSNWQRRSRCVQRLVRRHWRHTAWLAVCLMLLSIIGGAWNVRITQWGMALAQIWIMTVPCGIAVINKNKMLWILRQLCFGGSAAANIVAALK